MTSHATQPFLNAALAEGGQPLSIGGPPMAATTPLAPDLATEESARRFLAAAILEAGQPVSAGGPPLRVLPGSRSQALLENADCGSSASRP